MIAFKPFLFAFIFVFNWANIKGEGACGDWDAYKDEKCFFVFNNNRQEVYSEAKSMCGNLSASLVTIKSSEEQDFITKLVFDSHKIVDEVWIGAHRVDKTFVWDNENTNVQYTNWADKCPSNLAGEDCLQMLPKPNQKGKWDDESCLKKNVVICQKMQIWTPSVIQNVLLNERKQLQSVLDQLADHQTLINSQKSTIDSLRKEVVSLNLPVGFTYVQLPKEAAPTAVWPTLKWLDVSANYSGVFFRVLGGTAAKFGDIQEDDCPRLNKINISTAAGYTDAGAIIAKGGFGKIKAGITGGPWYFQFNIANTEVRPRNMAIRVWRRVA